MGCEIRVFGGVAVAVAGCQITEHETQVARGIEMMILKARKVGAKRVDLDGNEAGSVDEEQALNAQRAIAELRAAKWK